MSYSNYSNYNAHLANRAICCCNYNTGGSGTGGATVQRREFKTFKALHAPQDARTHAQIQFHTRSVHK